MQGWSVPLEQLAAKANVRIDKVVGKVTLDLFARVVLRSPVDTGRFRANWNVSYGSPDASVSDSMPAKQGAKTGLTLEQVKRLPEMQKTLSLPVGGVTFLSNNLPYAQRLEYGYSKQAPQGMVRLSVQQVRDAFGKAGL